jgi:chitodextrinase
MADIHMHRKEISPIQTKSSRISIILSLFLPIFLILALFFCLISASQTLASSPDPAGTNFNSNGTIYFINSSGQKQAYTSAGAFISYQFNLWKNVVPATSADLALPSGPFVPPQDGSLINDHGTIYAISKGQRVGFTTAAAFLGLGYSFSNAIPGDTSFLATLKPIATSTQTHPFDTLVNQSGTIYLLTSHGKIGIPNLTSFNSWGYKQSMVVPANQYDLAIAPTNVLLPQRPAGALSAFTYVILQGGGLPVTTDLSAPTTPTNLSVSSTTQNTVTLTWTASTDNVGVAGYDIFRNGIQVGTPVLTPTFTDAGLTPSTTYAYTVEALDASGNKSAQSTSISATTQASTVSYGGGGGGGGGGGSTPPADTTPPSVPTGLTVSSTTSSTVSISWTASTDNVGVTGYTIFNNGSQVGTSQTTSYTDSGLSPSTNYTYTVLAYDAAANNSTQSSSVQGTTASSSSQDTTPPSVPTSLTNTTTTSTTESFSWTASTDNVGVTGYKVFRNGSQIGTSSTPSYSDSALNPSTQYSYTVSAYDAAGNNSTQSSALSITTQASQQDTTPPTVPTGLASMTTTSTSEQISWSPSTDNVGVTGYNVLRNGSQVGTSSATAYTDLELSPSTNYSYTVEAYDAAGNTSAQSTALVITTSAPEDVTPPSVPTNLSSSNITQTTLTISWTASTDDTAVTGYNILRNGTQLGTSATTSFNDSGLTANTTYTYTVEAYDAASNTSAQSTGLQVTTQSSSGNAPITMTANITGNNFEVLAGSTRQINVNIFNGSTTQCAAGSGISCTVNWSVASTTGGASATFTDPTHTQTSSINAALPTIQVNIGSTAGTCSISGSIGSYTVSSTATVTVQAQSTDNTNSTASFLFNVCSAPALTGGLLANGTNPVIVAPAYQQAYKNQPMTLQSWVQGCVDESVTWSILNQPSGGNGSLIDTANRDAVFTGSVTGRYTIQATYSGANCYTGSVSNTAIVYVSPNNLPSYAATPNGTRPTECYDDPALTGGDYEVGAEKQYTTIQSTPAANTLVAGSIIRIWNTDTTGQNPSIYHEYYQIHNTGSATQPMIVCGVPDSQGNLPILDGSNATAQSGTSTGAAAGYGIISVWGGGYGSGSPYGYWQSGSAGPSYVSITGLHLEHGSPVYNFTPPGGGAETPYVDGSSCLNIRSGSYIDLSGNDLDTCSNSIFTAENGNSAWASITQDITIMGNHIHGSGIAGDYLDHQVYLQSFYLLLQGNLIDNYLSTAQGGSIKWRGVEGIFRYNDIGPGPYRVFDMVDNQDASQYVTLDSYLWGGPSNDNCDWSPYCEGDTAGATMIAAYQESAQKDFVYGNLIFSGPAQYAIHYAEDHDSGLADRNGTLYFYNNTMDSAQVVFDTGSANGYDPIFPQRVDAQNNIFWTSGGDIAFNRYESLILNAKTNLMHTGTFSIATPITGGSYNAGNANGWEGGCDYTCQWPLTNPIDPHLYGLNSANYLSTSTQPYDPTTMVPPSGSAAIGAGTALSGPLANMPVRWNYNIATHSLTPRTDPLTIGAEDEGGQVLGTSSIHLTQYLVQGSTGEQVTILQQYLHDHGYLSIAPTGYFGTTTVNAVKAFQKAHNISQTGTVGPITRAAINGS